jgi:hypothetical protein
VLTIGFNVIYLTSKNGFEGCQILLCVNLKGGNDNWGLMWYRRGLGWRERELDIEEEGEEEYGVSEESLLT